MSSKITLAPKWKVKSESDVAQSLLVALWTVAYQAPSAMGFSRQEYWSGVPFPSPVDLPNLGLQDCRQMLYRLSHHGSQVELEGKGMSVDV